MTSVTSCGTRGGGQGGVEHESGVRRLAPPRLALTSSPRAATSVATRTRSLLVRNSPMTRVRACWSMSPWSVSTAKPASHSACAIVLQLFLNLTKTMDLPWLGSGLGGAAMGGEDGVQAGGTSREAEQRRQRRTRSVHEEALVERREQLHLLGLAPHQRHVLQWGGEGGRRGGVAPLPEQCRGRGGAA